MLLGALCERGIPPSSWVASHRLRSTALALHKTSTDVGRVDQPWWVLRPDEEVMILSPAFYRHQEC